MGPTMKRMCSQNESNLGLHGDPRSDVDLLARVQLGLVRLTDHALADVVVEVEHPQPQVVRRVQRLQPEGGGDLLLDLPQRQRLVDREVQDEVARGVDDGKGEEPGFGLAGLAGFPGALLLRVLLRLRRRGKTVKQ